MSAGSPRLGLDLVAAREVWDGALCTQGDPALWFPEDLPEPQAAAATVTARQICVSCPVRLPCLRVFGSIVTHGVVGGLTAEERRPARRRRGGQAAAVTPDERGAA